MDLDAMREEYESRISDLNADIEHIENKYETQLATTAKETTKQRDRAIDLQKELNDAKKQLDALEGENADLQETVEAMEKNMTAVRDDFSSRIDAAREELHVQKEEYEKQINQLESELADMKRESREAMQEKDTAQDMVRKLEQELELKTEMIEKGEKEQQLARDMYEGRIDRIRNEIHDMKEEHLKEIGDILQENEKMNKEVDEERLQKRSAEYRVRRLEEEVEAGKSLLEQAKKDADESKEEYEVRDLINHVNYMTVLFVHCMLNSNWSRFFIHAMIARHGRSHGQDQ